MEDVEVDLTPLIPGFAGCPMKEVGQYMSFFVGLNEVMCAFAYLRRYVSDSEAVTRHNKIVEGIKVAMTQVSASVDALRNKIDVFDGDKLTDVVKASVWRVLQQILMWVAIVSDALPHIGSIILGKALDEAKPLVKAVKDHTPEWEHVITDETYARALAKQVIIDAQFVDLLNEEVGSLFRSIFELQSLAVSWQCKSILAGGEEWTASLELASSQYTKGKKFLTVRACCNTVQVKTGTSQVDQAKLLLQRRSELPVALAKALDNCVHARGGFLGGPKRKHDDVDVCASPAPAAAGALAAANSPADTPTPPPAKGVCWAQAPKKRVYGKKGK